MLCHLQFVDRSIPSFCSFRKTSLSIRVRPTKALDWVKGSVCATTGFISGTGGDGVIIKGDDVSVASDSGRSHGSAIGDFGDGGIVNLKAAKWRDIFLGAISPMGDHAQVDGPFVRNKDLCGLDLK